VYSLVYVSRVAPHVTSQGLLDLMEASRTANEAAGITGLLLYSGGGFLQVLEGEREDVELLYASIENDPRHGEVTLVRAREQTEREFPDWSMAFGAPGDGPDGVATGALRTSPTLVEAVFVSELLGIFDTDR
jgi:hypothetical protein